MQGFPPFASYHTNQVFDEHLEGAGCFSSGNINRRIYVDPSFLVSLVCFVSHEQIIAEENREKN